MKIVTVIGQGSIDKIVTLSKRIGFKKYQSIEIYYSYWAALRL